MSLIRFLAKLFFWLLALIGALSLAAVIAGLFLAFGFERPSKSIADGTVLTLDLAEPIPESLSASWLEPWRKSITMPELVQALNAAAKDPRIKGLMLRVGGDISDMGHAQELRAAFKTLREGGKTVHAYAESFGEAGNGTILYYVASSADRIFLQPSGEVGLLGFRLEMPFIRGALDWLGIEPRTSQRREYKSVPYVFTETTMPEPVRRNLQELADSWLDQVVNDIAKDRKETPDAVRNWVDSAPWGANDALKAGLVDGLSYWSETKNGLADDDHMASVADYWAQMPDPPGNAPKIGLVSAVGPVVLGAKQKDPFGEDEIIASLDVANAISKAIEEKVAAIVIRIDSPGGSYVAADQIWREVGRAQSAGIPVVVSMIGTAASGGYFIAAPAGKIVAEPGTITGSIGVFAGKPVMTGLWTKLGISIEGVSAGAAADMDSVNVDFSPRARANLEARMDAIYADFVGKVADGRGMTPEKAEAAAKGQVWSGADAKERGLVDELGGFQMALDLARSGAKLAPEVAVRIVPYPTPETPLQKIMSMFGDSAKTEGKSSLFLHLFSELMGDSEPARLLENDLPQGPLWMPPIIVNGG